MSFINLTLKVNQGEDDSSAISEILEVVKDFDYCTMINYQVTTEKSENNKLSGITFSKKDAEVLKKFAEDNQVVLTPNSNNQKVSKNI